jgi:hypothetical protein
MSMDWLFWRDVVVGKEIVHRVGHKVQDEQLFHHVESYVIYMYDDCASCVHLGCQWCGWYAGRRKLSLSRCSEKERSKIGKDARRLQNSHHVVCFTLGSTVARAHFVMKPR